VTQPKLPGHVPYLLQPSYMLQSLSVLTTVLVPCLKCTFHSIKHSTYITIILMYVVINYASFTSITYICVCACVCVCVCVCVCSSILLCWLHVHSYPFLCSNESNSFHIVDCLPQLIVSIVARCELFITFISTFIFRPNIVCISKCMMFQIWNNYDLNKVLQWQPLVLMVLNFHVLLSQ